MRRVKPSPMPSNERRTGPEQGAEDRAHAACVAFGSRKGRSATRRKRSESYFLKKNFMKGSVWRATFSEDDLQVRVGIPQPGPVRETADPRFDSRPRVPVGSAAEFEEGYGVAVDLGTTHISLTLWDLGRGRRLSGRFGLNRQFCFGSDVMTRMVAASRSTDVAGKICGEARRSISDALSDLCSGEGWNPQKVKRISIVGNSPMLAFLAGKNYDLLLSPHIGAAMSDCLAQNQKGSLDSAGVDPDVAVDIVQPLAGFIGSDLIAGVIATHLMDKEPGSLLIDFGTNSEIACWDGSDLWTTSEAGGPAFEGGGINCGMPAEPGAIFRIHTGGDFESGPAEPVAEVIGGGEPRRTFAGRAWWTR